MVWYSSVLVSVVVATTLITMNNNSSGCIRMVMMAMELLLGLYNNHPLQLMKIGQKNPN